MMDYFGLNSLVLTITPDDKCSFRVRLYADPNNEVQINDVKLKFIYVHFNGIMFCFNTTQHDLPNVCNF